MYSDYRVSDRELQQSYPPPSYSISTPSYGGMGGMDSHGYGQDRIYNYRPAIPPSPEEVSEQLLDKLEQAGRVPSKEKFRRMACNVSNSYSLEL